LETTSILTAEIRLAFHVRLLRRQGAEILQILMTGIVVASSAKSGIRRRFLLQAYDFSIFRQALEVMRVRD
jgi:hypothetical protein